MNTDEIVADYYNNFPECPQDLIGCTLDQEDVDEFNRARKRGEQWLRNTISTLLTSEAQKREEDRDMIFGEIEQFKAEVVAMDYCDDFKDGIYASIEHILSIPFFENTLTNVTSRDANTHHAPTNN